MAGETLLAVCGAHMQGLALNDRLTLRGARLAERTRTAADYRLFALTGVDPPRPGLIRVAPGQGRAVELEVWHLSETALGAIAAEIDLPLAIGTVVLEDGRRVTGFVCEAIAAEGAHDITHLGSWRVYLAGRSVSDPRKDAPMTWNPMTGPLDLSSLAALYAAGEITPVDVVGAVHDRIEARGDDGVWITLLPREEALARARAVMERGTPETLPLYGVPFGIKDNFDLEGVPTTMAVPAWKRIAEASSPTVAALIEAGAIPIGKQNMDQLGMGLVGVRTGYTVPSCVFDDAYISGGSSSGGGVSVAAGLVSFACANDAAGSGRVPAALNNIVGYKPTPGLVPRSGVSVAGMVGSDSFLTLSVADAVALTNHWIRYDPEDPFSKPAAAGFRLTLDPAPTAFRFAVPDAASIDFDGDDDSARLFADSVTRLEALGGTAVEIDLTPFLTAARLLYEGPYIAQRYANFGPRMEEDPGALHPATAEILSWGREYSAADLFAAQYRMGRYAQMARALFSEVDVLVTPTSPSTYTIADLNRDNIALNARMGTYTNFVNLLDLPSVSVPAGFRADGKALGTMLIGPSLGDCAMLAIAAALHAALAIAPGLAGAGAPNG